MDTQNNRDEFQSTLSKRNEAMYPQPPKSRLAFFSCYKNKFPSFVFLNCIAIPHLQHLPRLTHVNLLVFKQE